MVWDSLGRGLPFPQMRSRAAKGQWRKRGVSDRDPILPMLSDVVKTL